MVACWMLKSLPSGRRHSLSQAPGDTGCSLTTSSCSRTCAQPKQTALDKATRAPQGPPHPKTPQCRTTKHDDFASLENNSQAPSQLPPTLHHPLRSLLRLYHRITGCFFSAFTFWERGSQRQLTLSASLMQMSFSEPVSQATKPKTMYITKEPFLGQRIKKI